MSEASLSCSSHAVLGSAPGAASAAASADHEGCIPVCACAADACSGGALASASGASQPCSAPGGCKQEVSDTALSVQTCHLDGMACHGLSSPGSSSCCPSPAPCSAPTAAAPAAGGAPQHHHHHQQQQQQGQSQAAAAYEPGPRDWQYHLVTFPAYFTPCAHCCGTSKPVKREQLLTLFDLEEPSRVYCSHCPEAKMRGPALLQVRRSAFKDVVKATDLGRFGADAAGVQQYTLNGSKVIYLNREALVDKKSSNVAAAPATCLVDGRAMMDKTSLYCSLKCKMTAEDPGFTAWLGHQDPALLAAANAAANAPPRPTVACKRTAPSSLPSSPTAAAGRGGGAAGGGGVGAPSSSGSGCAGSSSSQQRPKKAPRIGDSGSPASVAAAAAAAGGGSSSGGAGCTGADATTTRRSAAAAAATAGKSGKAVLSGPSAFAERAASAFPSLPRIRTSPSVAAAAAAAGAAGTTTAPTAAAGGLARYSSAPAGLAGLGGGSSSSLMASGGLDAWGCSSGPCSDPYAPWGSSSEDGVGSDGLLASPMLGCHPLASPGCHSLGSSLLDCSSPRLLAPQAHNSSAGAATTAAAGAGLAGGSSSEWWLPTSPMLGGLVSRLQSAPAGGLCSLRLLGAPFEAPLSGLNASEGPLSSCELEQLSVLPTGPSLSLGSGTSLVTTGYLAGVMGDDGVSLLGCPGEVPDMLMGEDLYTGIVAAH